MILNPSGLAIRLTVLFLGAIPATVLSVFVFLLIAGSVGRLSDDSLTGPLGVLWGIMALMGAASAWLFVVGWSQRSVRRSHATIVGIVAGAIAVALVAYFIRMSSFSLWHLVLAAPFITGLTTIYILLPSQRITASAIASVPIVVFATAVALSTMSPTVEVAERRILWSCGTYGTCEEFFTYSFLCQEQTHHLNTMVGLIDHLRAQQSSELKAVFHKRYFFGQYEGYQLVNISGFDYSQPNLSESPLPPQSSHAQGNRRECTEKLRR